jgi:DinB superfamily
MHSHLQEVFDRLDRTRAALCAAVNAVPAEDRRTRPSPDRWSAAEVVEHLSIVERLFRERIARAIEAAGALARESSDRIPLPPPIEARMADRVNRRNAPEVAVPTGAVPCETGLQHVEEGHAQLRALVSHTDGLALSRVTSEHPFFGALNVYQWIELIAAHEARHTEQIREIAGALAT